MLHGINVSPPVQEDAHHQQAHHQQGETRQDMENGTKQKTIEHNRLVRQNSGEPTLGKSTSASNKTSPRPKRFPPCSSVWLLACQDLQPLKQFNPSPPSTTLRVVSGSPHLDATRRTPPCPRVRGWGALRRGFLSDVSQHPCLRVRFH